MNRLDWVIVRRLLGSVALTLAVLFGIVVLVEATNVDRFQTLLGVGGVPLALAGLFGAAARLLLDTLPLTVLVGAVAGLLDLQSTREMTVIKAAGVSVWRLMQAPLATTLLGALVVALAIDTGVVVLNRTISPLASSGATGNQRLWLEERGAEQRYMLEAGYGTAAGDSLSDVTIFLMQAPRDRIVAPAAKLEDGHWVMAEATRYRSNGLAETLTDYRLASSQTEADMQARFSSVPDMTVWELAAALSTHITDRRERAEIEMRFVRLIGLPLTLCGSLVIAFAFTAGYRRTNKYGGAVLYGIVLGSLVYVVTELAGRAGSAGIVHPAIAVAGPAAVAAVVGVTVLLNREDGRT
jgi:lipopolysaccharide export system permease protein